MLKATDCSNYTSDLTTDGLEAWKAEGVGLVIVQAIDPPPNYPPGKTREQIQQCLAAGFAVDAYLYLWFSLGPDDITRKLSLLEGLPVRQLWLDVEDTAASEYDQMTKETKVQVALSLCDAFMVNGPRTGIYTGGWFWADPHYMNNTPKFSDRKLWTAQYDGIPDATVFTPYGGWHSCRIKQFAGTSELGGITGVDINVLSDAEAAEITPAPPQQNPCEDLIGALAYVCDNIGDNLWNETTRKQGMRKTYIRDQVAEMRRVREQFIGPRPT